MFEPTFNIPNTEIIQNRAYKPCARIMTFGNGVKKALKEDFLNLLPEEEEYKRKGTGYSLFSMLNVYTPLGGKSLIPLPLLFKNNMSITLCMLGYGRLDGSRDEDEIRLNDGGCVARKKILLMLGHK